MTPTNEAPFRLMRTNGRSVNSSAQLCYASMLLCALVYSLILLVPCHVVRRTDEIVRPKSDPFNYRFIELSNGLRAILVQMPKNLRFHAKLYVDVGFVDDPHGVPGAAHLLEHVLYTGSSRYPEAGAYWKALNDNGCKGNGTTTLRKTYFAVNGPAAVLESMLDMFVDALVNPLFVRERIENEITMVDNEFIDNSGSAPHILAALEETLLHVNEQQVGFGVGNAESLRSVSDIESILRSMHKDYYVAPNMTLFLLSGFDLDHMETVITNLFSALPGRPPVIDWDRRTALLTADRERLGVLAHAAVFKGKTSMMIVWEVPNNGSLSEYWAAEYVMRMLSMPFKGFFVDMLKQFALALDAGSMNMMRFSSCPVMRLRINIHLTSRGAATPVLVIDALIQALKHLATVRPTEQLWNVLQDKELVKMANASHLDDLGEHLSEHEPKRCIVDQFMPPPLDQGIVHAITQLLEIMANPDNMLALVSTPRILGSVTFEKYYSTGYYIEDIRLRRMLKLNKSFLCFDFADKFELFTVSNTTPLVCGNSGESCSAVNQNLTFNWTMGPVEIDIPMRFWYALDERTEDAHVYFSLRSCDGRSAEMNALHDLWVTALNVGNSGLVRVAEEMGVNIHLPHSSKSLQIQISGRHALIVPILSAALSNALGDSIKDMSQESFILHTECLSVALSSLKSELSSSNTINASNNITDGLLSGASFVIERDAKREFLRQYTILTEAIASVPEDEVKVQAKAEQRSKKAASLAVIDLTNDDEIEIGSNIAEKNSSLQTTLNEMEGSLASCANGNELFARELGNAVENTDLKTLARLFNTLLLDVVRSSLGLVRNVAIDVMYRGPLAPQDAFNLVAPIINQVEKKSEGMALCAPETPLRSLVPSGAKIISVATAGDATSDNNVVRYTLYMEPAAAGTQAKNASDGEEEIEIIPSQARKRSSDFDASEYKSKRQKQQDALELPSSTSATVEEPRSLFNEIIELEAATKLLSHILYAPFYNELRTEQVLGYTVTVEMVFYWGRPALQFTVAGRASPIDIETQIELFLSRVPALIRGMSPEQYRQVAEAVGNASVVHTPSARFEADRHEIQLNRLWYGHKNRAATTMFHMEQETLAKMADSHVAITGAASRRLAVHVWATGDSPEQVITRAYGDLSNKPGTIVCTGLDCAAHMESVSSTWPAMPASE